LTFKKFLIQLAILVAFVAIILMAVLCWLRIYTNHGQELTLPDYIGKQIDSSQKDAEKKSFSLIVNDSIHIVDKPGGEIIEQNPKGGAKVKENRKIYVTITKGVADRKSLSSLPSLYGRNYSRKQKELSHMYIYTKIKDYQYDSGEPDHILDVWYNGERVIDARGKKKNVEIVVGDTLEFTLSKRAGAELNIPDLMCRSVAEAKMVLEVSELLLGDIKTEGDISDFENAKIVYQHPSSKDGFTITMGEAIHITVTQNGANCDN
jgi:beta-lactam-binding protein with PASTA domain